MPQPNRRQIIAGTAIASSAFALPSLALAARTFSAKSGHDFGKSLSGALLKRKSVRAYKPDDIPEHLMGDLLWAANGINRQASGGHTAPSWYGSYGADLYVADKTGVWRYDTSTETLSQVIEADIRAKVSPQPFVATAPKIILHVSDLGRMHEQDTTEQDRRTFCYVDSAIIAQNIYLYCAAMGLGTCLVGGIDQKAIAALLGLNEHMLATYAQPIGYPKAS